MKPGDLIAALDLPVQARVDRRVPKKMLVEHGAPTAADRRRIDAGVEEIRWIAALKPSTIGVPEFRDATREYLEIAVLTAIFRDEKGTDRLCELIHRAVPYPVFLIASWSESVEVSLAHKRRSQSEADETVLDGEAASVDVARMPDATMRDAFLKAVPVAVQARTSLFALYQSWMDAVFALLAARVTGAFRMPGTAEAASQRRAALRDFDRLASEVARLRALAAREKQVSRRVELNLEIERMRTEHEAARARL